MDRRTHRCNGSVAHESLRGTVDGVEFVEGELRSVAASIADVLVSPAGALDRQLIHGDGFCVLEEIGDFAFGFAVPSGFVGYVAVSDMRPLTAPTHRVRTMGAHIYGRRSIKTKPVLSIPFGASVTAEDEGDGFWRVADGYLSSQQVSAIDEVEPDAAATALRFLGVPYLWGGDSNFGIDCSGLIHIALRAAGLDCPRDSDQQEVFFAAADGELRRGDLVFWTGHVGMMIDDTSIVHANGHHMATTVEPLDVVVKRIKTTEGKDVLSYKRP